MKGDFSRGVSPDGKRGRRYRRVLLQQGRVLLDSDLAAAVDALTREDDERLRHVACAHGSSDEGYLCTSGRLLALFDTTAGLGAQSGVARLAIDYRYRYLGRRPALHIAASESTPAVVRVPLRAPSESIVLWVRVEETTVITVDGQSQTVFGFSPPHEEFQRAAFGLGSAVGEVSIQIPAGGAVWIALIEADSDAGDEPLFWSARGDYQVDGSSARLGADTPFPQSGFPSAAGFWPAGSPEPAPPLPGLVPSALPLGALVVAYLELWERHVTALEDPGIREMALGGSDTCTRTEVLGQVKVATVVDIPDDESTAAAVADAFERVRASGGTLTLSQEPSSDVTDPCALPELGGYTGADNRSYHLEVHTGGALADVQLKWSRNNGSELFRAELDESHRLLVSKSAPLASNDLVEVLSEVIDLGDEALATVASAGFSPASRAVGTLARLSEVPTVGSDRRVFSLVDSFDTAVPVSLAALRARFGDLALAGLKLRRWDGVVSPRVNSGGGPISAGPHPVEDGIQVTFSAGASYYPGQYWQHEARVGGANANGVPTIDPHGPQRRFAPLALFRYQGALQPLELLAWLDRRYPRLCSIAADDVRYDGARVESPSQSVQEALDELFERGPEIITAGCGEIVVRPENDLQAVFDTIPTNGHAKVCIHPGAWSRTTPVRVRNKGHLVIQGAGSATRIVGQGALAQLLVFENCGRVALSDVAFEVGAEAAESRFPGALTCFACGDVELSRVSVVSAATAPVRRYAGIKVTSAVESSTGSVRIRDCEVEVAHAQTAIFVGNAELVEVSDNRVRTRSTPLDIPALVRDPVVAGWLGRQLFEHFFIGENEEANDELLVGSSEVVVQGSTGLDGRPRIIFHLEEWAHEFVTFSTHPALDTSFWEQLLVANPISRFGEIPWQWILANLRRLRTNLARFMFLGRAQAPGINVPSALESRLLNLAGVLTARDSRTTGGQGIVVGARRASGTSPNAGPLIDQVPPYAPDVRVDGNHVDGFMQGIHVAASHGDRAQPWLWLYRARVHDNTVIVRTPPIARERHGIFVGNCLSTKIVDNHVQLDTSVPANRTGAPPIDGVRVWGMQGPMLKVAGNHTVGVDTGVRVNVLNPTFHSQPGVAWVLRDNAYQGPGVPLRENIP